MMDENGNKIVMSSDGILIQSDGKIEIKAQQDVKVEGLNVEQKHQPLLRQRDRQVRKFRIRKFDAERGDGSDTKN